MIIRVVILVLSFLLAAPCLVATTETATSERSESTELTVTASSSLTAKRVFQRVKPARKYIWQSSVTFHYEAWHERPTFKNVDLHILLKRLII